MAGKIAGITISFRGDTTNLTKALKTVRSETNALSREMGQIDKALKFNPGNIDLWRQKQTVLKEEIQKTEQNLKELKAAQAEMDKNGVDKNSAQYRELQREIIKNESKLKEFKAEMKNMQSPQIEALRDKFRDLGTQLQAIGDKLKTVSDSLKSFGSTMTRNVTMPIAAGFAGIIKTTADFDQSMSNVKALSGATADEFDALRDTAREWAATTRFTATDTADALSYMALAGWDANQMMGGLPGVLSLAEAGMSDLATTSDIVTDGLTAFHMEAEQSAHFADVLAVAMSKSNTTTEMLGEAFKYVAPVAGAAGYSIEDVAVALGLMANSGIKASQGGTTLRNIIQRMAAPTDAVKDAMEALDLTLEDGEGGMLSFAQVMDQMRASFKNIKPPTEETLYALQNLDEQYEEGTIGEEQYIEKLLELTGTLEGSEQAMRLQAASTIAGTRGMAGLLAIVTATDDDYNKLTKAINGASETFVKTTDGAIVPMSTALEDGIGWVEEYEGAAASMAATMRDNAAGDADILKSKIQDLAIELGDILIPIVRDIVEKVGEWVDAFKNLSTEQQQTILTVAGIVAAIGPLASILGSVVSVIGGVVKGIGLLSSAMSFLLSPAGLVVAAIAAVIAIGVLVVKNWDKIKETAEVVWNAISEFFTQIGEKISEVWDNVKTWTTETWDKVKTGISNAWESVKAKVTEAADKVKTKVSDTWSNIKTKTSETWDSVKTGVSNAWTSIKEGVTEKANAVKDGIVTAFDFAKTFLAADSDEKKKMLIDSWNGIKDKASEIWKKVADFITKPMDKVKETVAKIADTIGEKLGFSGLGDKVRSLFDKIKGFISDPIESAKKLVTDAVDKIKSIFPISMGKIFSGIKLPHFKISGGKIPWGIGGAGEKPSVSIEWYAKGGIFRRPTIFANGSTFTGVGEAGAEAVLPLDLLWDNMQNMGGQIVQGVTASNDRMDQLMMRMIQLQGEMLQEMRRPKDFKVDGRWAGRYVADLIGG